LSKSSIYKIFIPLILILIFIITSFSYQKDVEVIIEDKFLLGNEVLLSKSSDLIKDKRIGLITNRSGVLSDGSLLLDSLVKNFTVTKIFTPEHGLRVDDKNENYLDEVTGIPVVSLYGQNRKPEGIYLSNVDVMVYDIQDVGARFYTFINTMYYCMHAAIENDKEIIICDRPIILYGNYVDGFMLNPGVSSFVGLLDISIAYGMTCGELANFINWENFDNKCNLTVVKMENYDHSMDYSSLNLPWIKPSPNMYYQSSAICYPGTCLFEGTNFAEGRGTDRPFEYVGAPYCNGETLAKEMSACNFKGVNFESISFTPHAIISPSNPPKYTDELCGGVYINVNDIKTFEPVKVGIALLVSLKKLFPQFEINKNNFLDNLAGTKDLRIMLNEGKSYDDIIKSYSTLLDDFKAKREKYLLY